MAKPSIGSQLDFSNPINSNIIGCWIFNEGSGTTVADLSGSNNHGIINGTTWNLSGRDGPSLDFDGINDDITFGIDPNFSTNEFTTSTWVKSSSLYGPIIANVTFSPTSGIYFEIDSTYIYAGTGDGTNKFYSIVPHGGLIPNTWYHLAITVTTTTIKVYVDGININTNSTGTLTRINWQNLNSLKIGRNNGSSYFYNGSIDEVRLWNRVLLDAEILMLYTSPYSMFIGSCPPLNCSLQIS